MALFALTGCKDFDPYQKVDYAQQAYDRHMKNGDITPEQRDIGMKPFNSQGTPPPVAQKTPSGTQSSSASSSSDTIPPPPFTAPNSPENSPPVVAPAATPTNWP